MTQDVKAQHTPSDAAKRQACELAQKHAHDDPNFYKPKLVEPYNPTLYALALRLDFEDRVARELDKELNVHGHGAGMPIRAKLVRSLMLPDPVDQFEKAIHSAMLDAPGGCFPTAKAIRAELDKRGLTIAPKENLDAK